MRTAWSHATHGTAKPLTAPKSRASPRRIRRPLPASNAGPSSERRVKETFGKFHVKVKSLPDNRLKSCFCSLAHRPGIHVVSFPIVLPQNCLAQPEGAREFDGKGTRRQRNSKARELDGKGIETESRMGPLLDVTGFSLGCLLKSLRHKELAPIRAVSQ
jgi:hypothetical protein